jgi:hypothetical protein
MSESHFVGCHPDDSTATDPPADYLPQEQELCWHCAQVTRRGCSCIDCWENMDTIPLACVYHCMTCGRWWAWMTLRVTELTF